MDQQDPHDPAEEWPVEEAPGRRRRSRLGLWIGFGIGAAVLLSLTCLGGLGLLVGWGMGMVTEQVETELRRIDALREHVGEIQEFELDWFRSFSEPSEDVFVYRLTGSRASGLVRVESLTIDSQREELVWAELLLPSGECIELVRRTQ
jgi:hypothetical protein